MDGGENDYAGFSVIGQSPFASTYRAFLPRLHAPVVVRVFASVIAEAPDAEERFVAEIRAIAAIDDPRLEPPVELGTSERGDLYVTRRRLSDESLGRLAEQGRLLGLPEALRVGAELADVAAHLDRRGVAHHAISPNNTFIGADGAVVVTDPIPAIALEGVPLGLRSRPAHVAPEILAGQPWSSAAESYSIMSTVTSILGHQALPTLITELVDECLAPEPTRRPAPAELAALLREARADLLTPRAPRRRRVIEELQTGRRAARAEFCPGQDRTDRRRSGHGTSRRVAGADRDRPPRAWRPSRRRSRRCQRRAARAGAGRTKRTR